MRTRLEMEKKVFQCISNSEDWKAVCGDVSISLEEFYQICDLMVDFDLLCLLDFFTEKNYNLIKEDVEGIKNSTALELIPEELLDKLKKK